MHKFITKVVKINDHNFNLFTGLILLFLIIDSLTNNFLSSYGISKLALITFLTISATIKIFFKVKNKVIIDSDTIKKISLYKLTILVFKFINNKKRLFLIVMSFIIGLIFLAQETTQQIISYLSNAEVDNYSIYGILITLYLLIIFITFYEEKDQKDNPQNR